MSQTHQIIKNCGNFSVQVLPGMIRYSEENEKGRGKIQAHINSNLPQGDGYVTKESDIQLGGFVHRRAAQEAVLQGSHLAFMSLQEKQKIVLKVCTHHLAKYGASGPEFYKHWMKRAQNFARYNNIQLPSQGDRESDHDYFRRLHHWTKERAENWPELRPAVGTHLVFSPDPKVWDALRSSGINERQFLRTVLMRTMKEFSDWRRQIYGPGRSMGWVAGSHVEADGAHRHPHIHVVVLKRDEAGKEVDWSVSVLKGRKGRENEPDPLKTIKHIFERNVEKAYERYTGQRLSPSPVIQEHTAQKIPLRLQRLGLRAVSQSIKPFYPHPPKNDLGGMLRIISRIQRQQKNQPSWIEDHLPSFSNLRKRIAVFRFKDHQLEPGD